MYSTIVAVVSCSITLWILVGGGQNFLWGARPPAPPSLAPALPSTTISLCEGALIQGWASLPISIFGHKIGLVSSVQRAFLYSAFEPFRWPRYLALGQTTRLHCCIPLECGHISYKGRKARTNKSRSRVSKHRICTLMAFYSKKIS